MFARRHLLGAAAGFAGLRALVATPMLGGGAASAAAPCPAAAADGIEAMKQYVRNEYAMRQHDYLPETLPNVPPRVEKAQVGAYPIYQMFDPPGGTLDSKEMIESIAAWHRQTKAPPFHGYGPFIAEGNAIVEEWEVFMFGMDGAIYNNQYCWVREFTDGAVAQVREYVDSHHVHGILALGAPWKPLAPPTSPRRRLKGWSKPPTGKEIARPLTAMETVWPIRQEFNLDPRMLRDVTPTAGAAGRFPATNQGNKALVRAMRDAQAKGAMAAVNALHGHGFRLYIAGEGPLGWDHISVQDIYAPLVEHLKGPIKVRYSPMVAEAGRVFEEMDVLAYLDDGTVYNNWHCFIHEIRDGHIVETREYLDTDHLWIMLARWADWGKTPVPPLVRARRSNLPFVRDTYQWKNLFLDLPRWKPLPTPA